MKKLNTFFLAAFVMLGGLVANADTVSFTINVSNPESVAIQVMGEEIEVSESNEITTDAYYSVIVTPAKGFEFDSIVNKNGTPQSWYANSPWSVYADPSIDGEVYTVTTYDMNESRTSRFALEVDDPSLVRIALGAEYSQYYTLENLTAGSNEVAFNPEKENWIGISPVSYDGIIYRVTLDGEIVSPGSWGQYSFMIADGSSVVVTAVIPEIAVSVDFEYSENGEGAISSVFVDGAEVADFDGRTVSMMAGQKLSLVRNEAFDIMSISINGGDEERWYGSRMEISGSKLLDDVILHVNASPVVPVAFTLDVDDPANIMFFNSMYVQGDEYALSVSEGVNELMVAGSNPFLSWRTLQHCYVGKVTVNGEDYKDSNISVNEGDVIKFETGRYVLDKRAVMWIGSMRYFNAEWSYYMGSDYVRVPFVEGYQLIEFYDSMNPYSFGLFEDMTAGDQEIQLHKTLYVNDEAVESTYGVVLEDGMVLKYFTDDAPIECEIAVVEGEKAEFSMVRDIIVPVEDFSVPVKCFAGTLFSVSPVNECKLVVSVDGMIVEADEKGEFSVVVTEDTAEIKVENQDVVGVDVITDVQPVDESVFNLHGVKVGSVSDIDILPAGIYVAGGRKVVVR